MKTGCLLASVLLVAMVTVTSAALAEDKVAAANEVAGIPGIPGLGVRHAPPEGIPVEKAEETGGCCACPPDLKVSGDAYLGVMNKYLFRGNDLSGNKPVLQGGIDLVYKEWTLSYWTNYQLKASEGLRNVTENDIYLNYVYSPHELVTLNVGDALYDYNNTTTNELYLKANLNTLLTPTLAVYWDWDKSSSDGLFYTASVSHKQVIERNVLSATLAALVSYNQRNWNAATDPNSSNSFDGAYSGFHNYELSVSLDYIVNGAITITPSYLFSDALSAKARDIAGIKAQHNYGIKTTFTF